MANPALASTTQLTIGDFTVQVKPNARARRLTLRYNSKKAFFTISTPTRISQKFILDFVAAQQAWMRQQVEKVEKRPRLVPANHVLFKGDIYRVIHHDGAGVNIAIEGQNIVVTCRASRLQRALLRFLQQQALTAITQLVEQKAALINKKIGSVTLRDTTSRWGSCAHNGNLSFSWRLIMAPPETLDYVVAHEVAHLQHFDHSPAFWALCRTLSADYTNGKHWLKINGAALQGIAIA